MANWVGYARSNYFKVKDTAAFKAWADTVPDVEVIESNLDKGFMIEVGRASDNGGWPSTRFDDDKEDDVPFDLWGELAPHLVDGEVAIMMEIGHEGMRYVTGHAVAVHSSGKHVAIGLTDIYGLAAKKFKVPLEAISEAQY